MNLDDLETRLNEIFIDSSRVVSIDLGERTKSRVHVNPLNRNQPEIKSGLGRIIYLEEMAVDLYSPLRELQDEISNSGGMNSRTYASHQDLIHALAVAPDDCDYFTLAKAYDKLISRDEIPIERANRINPGYNSEPHGLSGNFVAVKYDLSGQHIAEIRFIDPMGASYVQIDNHFPSKIITSLDSLLKSPPKPSKSLPSKEGYLSMIDKFNQDYNPSGISITTTGRDLERRAVLEIDNSIEIVQSAMLEDPDFFEERSYSEEYRAVRNQAYHSITLTRKDGSTQIDVDKSLAVQAVLAYCKHKPT